MVVRPIYRWVLIAAGIVCLLSGVGYLFFYYQERPDYNILLESMPPVEQQTKLLVIAPHCDDEAIGCAGVIHDVVQAGGQVAVVIMTNGDGFTFATEEQLRRFALTSADYIHSGYIRQKESVQALQLLGVPEGRVFSLGYPDRGLNAIWSDYWDADKPYTSHFTGKDHSPYSNSYQPNAAYSGQVVVNSLEKILDDFQPTLILLPHPRDEHHDHSAAWAFAVSAIAARYGNGGTDGWPKIYTYLVHRGDFPIPHGYKPQAPLLPPRPLANTSRWYTYKLDGDIENLKERAIKEYASQIRVPIMSKLLYSFIRNNELFEKVAIPRLEQAGPGLKLAGPDAWRDREPVLMNPVGVNLLGALEREARLASVYSCLQGDAVWLRFHIPDFMERHNRYHVSVIQFHRDGTQLARATQAFYFTAQDTDLRPDEMSRSRDDAIVTLSFNHQDVPDFFFIQVMTTDKLGAVIDQTVWQPVIIR